MVSANLFLDTSFSAMFWFSFSILALINWRSFSKSFFSAWSVPVGLQDNQNCRFHFRLRNIFLVLLLSSEQLERIKVFEEGAVFHYSLDSQHQCYSGEVQSVIRSLVVDVLRFTLLFNLEFSAFKCATLFFTFSKISISKSSSLSDNIALFNLLLCYVQL